MKHGAPPQHFTPCVGCEILMSHAQNPTEFHVQPKCHSFKYWTQIMILGSEIYLYPLHTPTPHSVIYCGVIPLDLVTSQQQSNHSNSTHVNICRLSMPTVTNSAFEGGHQLLGDTLVSSGHAYYDLLQVRDLEMHQVHFLYTLQVLYNNITNQLSTYIELDSVSGTTQETTQELRYQWPT